MGNARSWQGPKLRKQSTPAAGKSRRGLVIGISFVILALAGGLLALLLIPQGSPEPLLVVIRVDQYHDLLLPTNPWGEQDREALHRVGLLHEQGAYASQDRQFLLREFKKLSGDEHPAKQPIVIFLSAYATAVKDGVAVLPTDARLDEPDSWVPLKEILALLKDCRAGHKLLLLDLTLPSAAPRGGLLANDVAEKLQPLLEEAVRNDPHLQILSAASPGQVSLASEEMKQTVFAHYVAQGLLGDADGCLAPKQPANQRVSVQELRSYVTSRVDAWASHNRRLRQTPVFFGSAADYDLKSISAAARPPAPEPLEREYPKFLQKAWQERDKWLNDRGSRTPAELYRQLDADTLRAEERWRGGEKVPDVQLFFDGRLTKLIAKRGNDKVGGSAGEPQSLAQAVAAGQKPPEEKLPEASRELIRLAQLYVPATLPNANEKDKAQLAQDTEAFRKKYAGTPFEFAWTIFNVAAATESLPQDYLKCWYDLIQPTGQPPPVYREALLLKQLAKWRLEKPIDWPLAGVAPVLQLTREAETVEAGNPQVQPWLRTDYAEAAQQRRAAEKLFFDSDPAKRADAPKAVAAALTKYVTLAQRLDQLNDAQRQCDEALVFLPAYVAYLDFDDSNLKVWIAAVQTTRKLDGLLGKPALESLREFGELTATLRDSLRKLRQPLDVAAAQASIDASKRATGADALEMSVLLRLPGPGEAGRLRLWTNYRTVAARLHAEAMERQQHLEAAPPFSEKDAQEAVQKEQTRALTRARASLTLLRLAGSPAADKVEAELEKVTRTPKEEAAWLSLGRALSRAWKQYDADRARIDKN
jgi:hypothetical protein